MFRLILKQVHFSFAIITGIVSFAQTGPPNGMIYQAVARDGSGNLAAKRTIYVQTTVLKGSATGTVMYSDEHKVTSNADAMFTVIVGQGKYLSGTYSKLTDIPLDKDKYFFNLKICVAPTIPRFGWTPSYTDMGTTQFWSVPYAMFSGKSGDSLTLTVNGTGRQIKLGNYKPIFFSVADRDSIATNEIQTLSRTGGRLLLSLNGGMVTLPDSSSTNELQTITRTGGRIILNQNGGTIFLPDSSATNELQTISKTGSTVTLSQGGGSFTDDDKQTLSTTGTGSTKTLSISNGNSVQINVNDADSSTTNELQTISRTGGRIQLSQNGGTVILPDSSATNELQTISRTGGRITLNLNGGTVTLPDSSAWNEIQRLGITLTKGTIMLNNGGGSIQLADSSATNELQTISQSGNTITLSQGGGSVTITDNDKQQLGITPSKGTISLSNGGSIQLADSSATNEIQTVSISTGKGLITLSKGGGSVLLGDSSSTNELQTLSLINDTLRISNGNAVKLGTNISGVNIEHGINEIFSSTKWVVPSGVYSLRVEAIGGGGGGACTEFCPGSMSGGGGGGAGGYCKGFVKVMPLDTLNINIGLGGTAGYRCQSGLDGNSTFIKNSLGDTLIIAKGGFGGKGSSAGAGGTGSIKYGSGLVYSGNSGSNGGYSSLGAGGTVYFKVANFGFGGGGSGQRFLSGSSYGEPGKQGYIYIEY